MAEAEVIYAQNWEDAALETSALQIEPDDDVIAVAGAGCTALSLLTRGPRRLHAVDRNPAQIHLLRLKHAAVRHLPTHQAACFLGAQHCSRRREVFEFLSDSLPDDSEEFWRRRIGAIERGVISQGKIERYFAMLRWLIRTVHPAGRIEDLFALPTLEAQRRFYHDTWDTPGWRRLFYLGHKRILDWALDPSFYRHIAAGNLPAELYARAARCLTDLPIADNYFLSWILRGTYPERATGRPGYLQESARQALSQSAGALETHVADIRDFLRERPDSSCDKFYLSNVSEWLSDAEIAPFFQQVIRVARDRATVCYRALMVDRPLPSSVRQYLEEDSGLSSALAQRDRAFVNAAFHVVHVRKDGRGSDAGR